MAGNNTQQVGFDPNAFMQMLAMMQNGSVDAIREAKRPVGRIAESPKNRPRYDVMADENYKPFANPQYGRVGEDKLVQSNAAQPMGQGQPQMQPQQGQGWQGMLPGGVPWSADQPVSTLTGAPQQPRPSFPGGINPLTGLPPGTMPGDPAYQDRLVQGAPRAIPVNGGQPQPQQQQRDPQIQNLVDISMLMRGYRNDNPQLQTQPTSMFGAQPVTDAGDQSFSPGSVPKWTPQGQPQVSPVSNTQEGFNQPIESDSGSSFSNMLRGGINAGRLAQAPGLAAGNVAGYLGNVATHAGNQLPLLKGAYDSALGTVSTGQKALQAGAVTAGELAPAMQSASNAYNAMNAGANQAATASRYAGNAGRVANVLSGGSGVAGKALGVAGKVAAPLQAGMMGLEAGRLAFDPEFRTQSQTDYQSLGDKGAMSGLGQGLAAPISTIANSGVGLFELLQTMANNDFGASRLKQQAARPGAKKAMEKMKQRQQNNNK